MTNKRNLYIALVLNILVLLGQLWPEGAPPFARFINISTLIFDVSLILYLIKTKNTDEKDIIPS